jgi:Ca2+-binding RTX toxin-like protein
MDADGTNVRRLTDTPAPNFEPSWSPAGDRIVFMRRLTNQELFSIAPDGTGEVRLTADPGEDFDPSWSPDGTKIVWTSDRAGTYDLYTMDAGGTGGQQITSTAALDEYPDWRRTCGVTGAPVTNCGAVVANTIVGGGGDDLIWGGRGDDAVFGGLGADVLIGGSGDDVLQGEGGSDRLSGGPGPGDDLLRGGTGVDFLAAKDGRGHDTLNGGPDADGCLSDGADQLISC